MRVLFALFFVFLFSLPAFSIDNAQVWKPYLQNIEKEAKTSWYKASGLKRHDKECKINLFFNVKNTGVVSNIKVLASNCSEDMNELAIQALKDVAPFKPFPQAVYNIQEISIDFIFDYKLLPENKTASNVKSSLPQSIYNPVVQSDKEIMVQEENESNQIADVKESKFNPIVLYIIAGFLFAIVLTLGVYKFFAGKSLK